MKNLLKRILQRLLGISPAEYSASPETDVKPQIQPVPSTTLDESEPDMDGWQTRSNGERFRRIKHGGMGYGMLEDDEPRERGGSLTRNNPFSSYRP